MNSPFFILGTVACFLTIAVLTVDIIKMIQKHRDNQYKRDEQIEIQEAVAEYEVAAKNYGQAIEQWKEKVREYKQQIFSMAFDRMQQEGYVNALERHGELLPTKERRKLSYASAERYAIDFPCSTTNYVDQLANAFSESYQEQQELMQVQYRQVPRPPQQTTGRERIMPLADSALHSIVKPRETPLSTQYYDVDGSTEKTRREA